MKQIDAARAGLVLGLISIAYMVCNILLGKINASGAGAAALNVAGLLLWLFKLVLCIRLMKLFMQKYAAGKEDVTNGDTFRFGTLTALLSALIYSGFAIAWSSFIQPDMYNSAFEMARDTYSGMLTADQLSMFDDLLPKMPTYTFIANLLWCWIFGTVLAAIFSRNIPPRNPFSETEQ